MASSISAVNQFGRQIKVIGNTGSNSTREALHATEQVGSHCNWACAWVLLLTISSPDCLALPSRLAGRRTLFPCEHCTPALCCVQGFAVGMDAALQINPYYGKTSMAGLHEHFKYV